MRGWQAIVFDLDDTLYPERDYVVSGFQAVARWAERRLDIPSDQGHRELLRLFECGVRGDTFNQWLASHEVNGRDWIAELIRIYREHQPTLSPFAGARDLLDLLRARARLGLLSDGYLDVQRRKLSALDLTACFDLVVFSDEWGRAAWKPSCRPFAEALRRLQIEPSQCVYIADNPLKDFLGARQVGMSTIWLRRPEGEYADQWPPSPRHAPDGIVGSFSELQALLVK